MTGYLKWLIGQAAGNTPTVRPHRWPRLYAPVESRHDQTETAEAQWRGKDIASLAPLLPQVPEGTGPDEFKLGNPTPGNAEAALLKPPSDVARDPRAPNVERLTPDSGSVVRSGPQHGTPNGTALRRALPHAVQNSASLREIVEKLVTPVPAASQPSDPPVIRTQPAIPRGAVRTHAPAKREEGVDVPARGNAPRPPDPAVITNIHIGRVELTAITQPAPPRKASAASAKAPMSLEEYLHRRGGKPQ